MIRTAASLLALALALLSGCATSLSSAHTAQVVPKGHFEVVAGTGAMVPVGAMVGLYDTGKKAVDEISKQTQKDGEIHVKQETVEKAAIGAAVLLASPPSAVTEVTVRYGLVDRLDVGLRYSGPAFRLETHGQLVDTETWKVALGVGAGHHVFEGGLLGLIGDLDLAHFSRNDFDVSVIAGRSFGDFGAIYFGPKLVASKYEAEGMLVHGDQVQAVLPDGTVVASAQMALGHSLVYGGLVGARLGYKWVFLTAELGVYGSSFKPVILGKQQDLGGLIVYPMLGLVANY